MRQWELQRFGLDGLKVMERAEPRPGPGQLLLGLRALSLNFRDKMVVEGSYDPRLRLPTVPLSDAVWTVLEVGPDAVGFSPGDRVLLPFAPAWGGGPPTRALIRDALGAWQPGVATERRVAPARDVVAAPPRLSDVEAATLPCAGLTAWSALVTLGGLRPGQTVVATGSGGVAVFAAQIARQAGARVALVSGDATKVAALAPLADVVVERTAGWARQARSWAGGEGVDHVLDLGGADTLASSIEAVRPGGRVSVIGILGGPVGTFDLRPILMKQVAVQGVFVGDRPGLVSLCAAVETASWRPVVHDVAGFDDLPDALRALSRGGHVGKIALRAP